MAASPLTLFSSVLQAKMPGAQPQDGATIHSPSSSMNFAALVNASGDAAQGRASARTGGGAGLAERSRPTAAYTATERSAARVITPREAQRALDRLDQAALQRPAPRENSPARSTDTPPSASARDMQESVDTNSTATGADANQAAASSVSMPASPDESEAIAALRLELRAIVDSGNPASVDSLLQALPPEDEARALLFLQRFSVSAEAAQPASLQGIRGLLQKLHQALQFTADATGDVTLAAASTAPAAGEGSVALSSLLAAPSAPEAVEPAVSAGDEEVAPAADGAMAGTVLVMTPMAQSAIIPAPAAPVAQAAAVSAAPTAAVSAIAPEAGTGSAKRMLPEVSTSLQTAAPMEAVSRSELSTKAVNIEMLVPSLALSADEKRAALPEVELPKTSQNTQTSAAAQPQAAPAVSAQPLSRIEQQLQAFTLATQGAAVSTEAAAIDVGAAKSAGGVSAIAGVNGISNAHAAGGISGAATPSAASALSGLSSLVNNAPIREQVHVAITKAKEEGLDQITIQLDPLGLGRVEVKMHTGKDGQTSIAFMVDKPETFDALSRDARGLERSLQESGLKTDSGGMQFNLRQQPQSHADMNGGGQSSRGGDNASRAQEGAELAATPAAQGPTRHYRLGIQEGVDIQA